MARPKFSIKHVKEPSRLPKKMKSGRLYFVKSEGAIYVNYDGQAVAYGGKRGLPGPPGPAGDPQPELQEQLDLLTKAIFSLAELVSRLRERMPYDVKDGEGGE